MFEYDKYIFMLAGDIIVMKTKRFKVVFRQATKYLIPWNSQQHYREYRYKASKKEIKDKRS